MIIRNTLAKTAASLVGAWIGNAIIKNTNHYKPKGDKYRIDDRTLQKHNVTAVLAGTICPVLLSTLLGKSMVNMRHLGGFACAGMMISAVTTNHYYQKEQIKVRKQKHNETQDELKKSREECRDAQTERGKMQHILTHTQEDLRDANQQLAETQSELNLAETNYILASNRYWPLQERVRDLEREAEQLRQNNNPGEEIRLRLGALDSDDNSFTSENYFDNNYTSATRLVTAPDYTSLPELLPNNNAEYEFVNTACIISGKRVTELYQPVAWKTGDTYYFIEYIDSKKALRGYLRNPFTNEVITTDMLNTTDDNHRVLFRINLDRIRINRDINVSQND